MELLIESPPLPLRKYRGILPREARERGDPPADPERFDQHLVGDRFHQHRRLSAVKQLRRLHPHRLYAPEVGHDPFPHQRKILPVGLRG